MVCCPSCHTCFEDGRNELVLCNECVRVSNVRNQVFFEKGLWERNKKFSSKEEFKVGVGRKKRVLFPLNIPRELHELLWTFKKQKKSLNALIIDAIIDKYGVGDSDSSNEEN